MSNCKWLDKIKHKVTTKIPELASEENQDLLEDLIDDAFRQIINYSNASGWHFEWDNLLVTCVCTLYNYIGTEGSLSRNAGGVSDTYESTNILSGLLSRNISQYIRSSGYAYPSTRFDYPN